MDKKFEIYVKCSGCNNELFRDAEYIPQGDGVCIIVAPCPVCAAQQGVQADVVTRCSGCGCVMSDGGTICFDCSSVA